MYWHKPATLAHCSFKTNGLTLLNTKRNCFNTEYFDLSNTCYLSQMTKQRLHISAVSLNVFVVDSLLFSTLKHQPVSLMVTISLKWFLIRLYSAS